MSFLSKAEFEQALLEQLRWLGYVAESSKIINKKARLQLAPIIQLKELFLPNLEEFYG